MHPQPLNAGSLFSSRPPIGALATTQSVDAFSLDDTATAMYELNSSGLARKIINGTPSNISGEWRTSGESSEFEVYATLVSGSVSGDTTDTWLNLSTTRSWYISRAPVGSLYASITIEIRRKVDGVSLVSPVTISFSAESNPS